MWRYHVGVIQRGWCWATRRGRDLRRLSLRRFALGGAKYTANVGTKKRLQRFNAHPMDDFYDA
eukprot:2900990-Amphidinium_carterae.1